jgi:SAM-dependent methyltransferase
MVLQLIFLVLQLGFAVFLFFMCFAFLSGAPFVPTITDTARSMIALAHIKRGCTVYDLGSGNGKLILLAKHEGAVAVGFEINPLLVVLSNLRGARTYWKNFWHADISGADIIFVYLLPWRMERLAQKLKAECKPGALIVSNSFIFPGWKILRQDKPNHVYVFKV